VRERQLAGVVDGHDVQMRVRHLFADDQHADALWLPLGLLRAADRLGDREEMRGERWFEVDPVVDLVARHHERVAGHHRRDGQERHRAIVLPHEPSRQLSGDDPTEDAGHWIPLIR